MARITYPDPDGNPTHFDFDADSGEHTLGRHPQCSIVVKDSSVSRQHARVVAEGGAFRLEDMGSANGTFLGEERLTQVDLSGRVEFLLGEVPIVFEADKGQAAAGGPKKSASKKSSGKGGKGGKTKKAAAVAASETRIGLNVGDTVDSGRASGGPKPSRTATQQTLDEQLSRKDAELAKAQTRLGEVKTELRKQQSELEREAARVRELEKALAAAEKQRQKLRDELEEGEANLDDSAARVRELEGQIEDFVRKESEHADELSNLRIEVVHKDRQLQELRKALDLKEGDHQQMREEMRTLEDRFSEDTRVQNDLERRLAELREVIDEKENHVQDLRRALDEKDYEIRQVKLGVGMSDLEEERRKLLEDFYAANTEVRRLEGVVEESASRERERDDEIAGLKARVRQLQRSVEQQKDISEHVDYRARLRDIERLEGELRDAHAAIVDLTRRLKEDDGSPAAPAAAAGGPDTKALGAVVSSLGDSLKTLRSTLKDVGKGLAILDAVDPKSLADKDQKKLKRAKPSKALEGVNDALKVIDADMEKLTSALPAE